MQLTVGMLQTKTTFSSEERTTATSMKYFRLVVVATRFRRNTGANRLLLQAAV